MKARFSGRAFVGDGGHSGAEEVPALAELLADEKLSHVARLPV